MNTNLIIQNVLRKIAKEDRGGYIIVELGNESPKYPFTVQSDYIYQNYTLYPGINYIYVPCKQIQFAYANGVKSLTYINFDLVDNISTDKTYFAEIVNGTFQFPFHVKLTFFYYS